MIDPAATTSRENETASPIGEGVIIAPGVRLDPPHLMATSANRESHPANGLGHGGYPVAEVPPEAVTVEERPARRGGSLAKAELLLQSLQEQFDDISGREESLQADIQSFEQRRQEFEQWATNRADELSRQHAQVQQDLLALTARQEEFAARDDALDREWMAIATERANILLEKNSYREALQREHAEERHRLDQEKAYLDEATQLLLIQHAKAKEDADQELQAERLRLWDSLNGELEQARSVLATEQETWRDALNVEKSALDELRRTIEKHVAESQHEMAEAREKCHQEIWTARQDHDLYLESTRDEFNRERALLETRMQFQQSHLEKMRDEIEVTQNQYRWEREQESQRLLECSTQLDRQARQLDLRRQGLEELQASLERDRVVLSKTQQALTRELESITVENEARRDAWETETLSHQANLVQREGQLQLQSEQIETRQLRLERLRSEIESTHRQILEHRLAVEETLAIVSPGIPQDELQQRIESTEQELKHYFQRRDDEQLERRKDLLAAQSLIELAREAMQEEKRILTEWITRRDEDLRQREHQISAESERFLERDRSWRIAQEEWLMERSKAERVIRELLREIHGSRDESDLDCDVIPID